MDSQNYSPFIMFFARILSYANKLVLKFSQFGGCMPLGLVFYHVNRLYINIIVSNRETLME
jgi:hypothetical protein